MSFKLILCCLLICLSLNVISSSKFFTDFLKNHRSSKICYAIVFDAGSSGTRSYVYNWPCQDWKTIPKLIINEHTPAQRKVNPGISSFANNVNGLDSYFDKFFKAIKKNFPANQVSSTPLYLAATAGMRLLTAAQQAAIYAKIDQIFQASGFLYKKGWARTITGQEEGAFLWLGLNYQLSYLKNQTASRKTATCLDLGGASTQIAFIPTKQTRRTKSLADFITIVLQNYNKYRIYSKTYLNYGNDVARKNVIKKLGKRNPCYQKGFTDKRGFIGTGNPYQCRRTIRKYLDLKQFKSGVFMAGQRITRKDRSIHGDFQARFNKRAPVYAVSAFMYSASGMGVKNQYRVGQFARKINRICRLRWSQWKKNSLCVKNGKYCADSCFQALYASELMQRAYHVSKHTLVKIPKSISGLEPTWTLGYVLKAVSQLNCKNGVCNVSFIGLN